MGLYEDQLEANYRIARLTKERDELREALELGYGLLWLASTNDHPFAKMIRDARLTLGNALKHEGKKAGVQRAQDFLANLNKTDGE